MPDEPVDPAQQSDEAIKESLVEPGGSAANVDFGKSEPETSTSQHLAQAAEALTQALGQSQARSDALTSELASDEISGAIERGVDPVEALAAAHGSGLVPESEVEELAWRAAVSETTGMLPEEYDESDLVDDETDQAVEQRYAEILGQSQGIAEVEHEYAQADRQAQASLQAQVANHAESVAAMNALKAELQMSGPEFRAHLQQVDTHLEAGILGPQLDLDRLAANDPKLFDATLRSVSATLRQDDSEFDAQVVKAGVLSQQKDLADGLVVDGVPVKPPEVVPVDEQKYSDAVLRRTLSRPRTTAADVLPPPRPSVREGFTLDGKPTHPDDLPIGDARGGTARSRLEEELQRPA